MNENQKAQQDPQLAQQIAKDNELKTILNGKEVPLQEAQAAEEAFNQQNTQTGIQAHHDNSSEAVQVGQVGQNSAAMLNQEYAKAQAVKQSEVQSGQSHLEQHSQNAASMQSEAQKKLQEDQQAIQNAMDAKAKAKTKKGE